MIFKLYDCDVGMTIRGQNYEFDHVDSVTVDDPESTKLIRGANAGNKTGLAYTEGVKDAKTITTSVIGIPMALHNLLKEVYTSKERIDFWAISRQDGSSKMAKNAILSKEPMQLTLDQSPESMNTALTMESFDVSEVHKS